MPLTNLTKGTTVDSEGGSATANLAQGLTKLWSCWDSDAGSSNDSFNSSSLTDNATGRWTNNFTTNMGNANYSVTAAAAHISQSAGLPTMSVEHDNSDFGRTTSAVTTESAYASSSADRTLYDYDDTTCQVNGDLA
tara:strand:- start:55 stop:462 length:408 start_codon:yes stop_codon:yes gene_type:complete